MTGLDASLEPLVVRALEAGGEAGARRYNEVMAAAYSETFSDEEISAAAAFRSSAFNRKGQDLDRASRWAWDRFTQRVAADARAAVCRKRDCGPAVTAQPIAASPAASTRTP
jgi:hypothetical protein